MENLKFHQICINFWHSFDWNMALLDRGCRVLVKWRVWETGFLLWIRFSWYAGAFFRWLSVFDYWSWKNSMTLICALMIVSRVKKLICQKVTYTTYFEKMILCQSFTIIRFAKCCWVRSHCSLKWILTGKVPKPYFNKVMNLIQIF